MGARVHVDGVFDFREGAGNGFRSEFDKVIFPERKGFVIHPQERCLDFLVAGNVSIFDEHAASGNVYFAVQRDGDGFAHVSFVYIFICKKNALDGSLFVARERGDGIAHANGACFNLSLESAEGSIWAANALHRQIESFFLLRIIDVDGFKVVKECLAGIPGDVFGLRCHVIAFGGRKRNHVNAVERKFAGQLVNLLQDFFEAFLAVAHKIHLVDGKDEIANAHELADAGVTARLHQNALRSVHENHGEVGKRCAHRHITGVFFMPRGVGHDKAAAIRGEIAIRDVDGNALFAFSHETIKQKGIVNFSTAATNFAVQF